MNAIITALRDLAATIALGLCKLNEIQFNAPWNPTRSRCGGAGL